jgi:hypothetical protein
MADGAIPAALTADQMFDRVKSQERYKAIERAATIAPQALRASGLSLDTAGDSEADEKAEKRAHRQERDKLIAQQFTLERAVGVRARKSVTAGDMKERFAILKHAPMEQNGSATDAMKLVFNPVGVTLRNVRCSRCKQWGHQVGDRECSLRNELTNRDMERLKREDPMTYMPRDEPVYGGAQATTCAAEDDMQHAIQMAHGVETLSSRRGQSSTVSDTSAYIPESDSTFKAAQAAAATQQPTRRKRDSTHKRRHHHKRGRDDRYELHRGGLRHERGGGSGSVEAMLAGMSEAEQQQLLSVILQQEGDSAGAAQAAERAQLVSRRRHR